MYFPSPVAVNMNGNRLSPGITVIAPPTCCARTSFKKMANVPVSSQVEWIMISSLNGSPSRACKGGDHFRELHIRFVSLRQRDGVYGNGVTFGRQFGFPARFISIRQKKSDASLIPRALWRPPFQSPRLCQYPTNLAVASILKVSLQKRPPVRQRTRTSKGSSHRD
jgi:hypothetical protein